MALIRSEPDTSEATPTVAGEVARYLLTGETDPYDRAWPGGFMERAIRARNDLRPALADEVRRRTAGRVPGPMTAADTVQLTRGRVQPMVRGLFRRAEQDSVLATLERSVVFITSENVESVLLNCSFDHTAWALANLYLASLGVELLGDDAPRLVGLSEETTCYISAQYFAERHVRGFHRPRGRTHIPQLQAGDDQPFCVATEGMVAGHRLPET